MWPASREEGGSAKAHAGGLGSPVRSGCVISARILLVSQTRPLAAGKAGECSFTLSPQERRTWPKALAGPQRPSSNEAFLTFFLAKLGQAQLGVVAWCSRRGVGWGSRDLGSCSVSALCERDGGECDSDSFASPAVDIHTSDSRGPESLICKTDDGDAHSTREDCGEDEMSQYTKRWTHSEDSKMLSLA